MALIIREEEEDIVLAVDTARRPSSILKTLTSSVLASSSFLLQDGQSRTVRQFQFTDWPEQGVPKSGEGFIDFIGQVHKTKEQFGQDGPIAVHCRWVAGRKSTLADEVLQGARPDGGLFSMRLQCGCWANGCLHHPEYRPGENALRRSGGYLPDCQNAAHAETGHGAD